MGDDAGRAAALDRMNKWNGLLDALAANRAGDMTAEEVVDVVTAYVVSIHNIRIKINDQ